MGYYTPTEPIQLIDVTGADGDSGELDSVAGVDIGDEILYLWYGISLGSATNWSVRLQIDNPESPGSYVSVSNQNSFGQILVQNNTSTPVTSWTIPGYETNAGRSAFTQYPVVVPGMKIILDLTGDLATTPPQCEVWAIFSKRFG